MCLDEIQHICAFLTHDIGFQQSMKTTIWSEFQDKGDIIFEFTFVALELLAQKENYSAGVDISLFCVCV